MEVTSFEEYKKALKEHFPNQEDFDDLYLGKFINDPPWYVIAPGCSDPMGPKTCLVEQFSQPLPPNIFPKDLIKGWKDADNQTEQSTTIEASKDICKGSKTPQAAPTITTSTTPTVEARD